MKFYYYVCPRCGRTWRRYFPRSKMKCKFCNSTWKTKKAKGTRSHFSLKATFVWLIWIAAILFVLYKANAFVNMKAHMKPARNAAQVVENVDAENEEAVALLFTTICPTTNPSKRSWKRTSKTPKVELDVRLELAIDNFVVGRFFICITRRTDTIDRLLIICLTFFF